MNTKLKTNMNVAIRTLVCLTLSGTVLLYQPASADQTYKGICDASAAVAIDNTHFIVANDEDEFLRLYSNDENDRKPIKEFDFSLKLRTTSNDESDIEGSASIGDRVFWITSHGRDRRGKFTKNRYSLFATNVSGTGADLNLEWAGRYDNLVRDMLNPQAWSDPEAQDTIHIVKLLKEVTQLNKKEMHELAPKRKGLNVEALAATPDGSDLLIGLRNPIPEGKALLIKMKNVRELLSGKDSTAHFDQPIYLDLHGLGIYGMAYNPKVQNFVIIAGPPISSGPFKLFRWSGDRNESPVEVKPLLNGARGSRPEAVVVYPDNSQVQILYDGGATFRDEIPCRDSDDQSFMAAWFNVQVKKITWQSEKRTPNEVWKEVAELYVNLYEMGWLKTRRLLDTKGRQLIPQLSDLNLYRGNYIQSLDEMLCSINPNVCEIKQDSNLTVMKKL